MNSNVVVGYFGGTKTGQVLSQTLASTTETEVKIGTDTVNNTIIAVLAIPTQSQIQGSLTPLDISVNPALLDGGFNRYSYPGTPLPSFPNTAFDSSRPFTVRVCGTYTPLTGSSSVSWAPKIYLGASKAGTALVSPAAVANTNAAGATFGFLAEAVLFWDSTSQAVRGRYDLNANGTTPVESGWVTLTNNGASVASVASLQFCFSVTWGAANGGTTAVSEFSITQN
jgi:hypothetical protein